MMSQRRWTNRGLLSAHVFPKGAHVAPFGVLGESRDTGR